MKAKEFLDYVDSIDYFPIILDRKDSYELAESIIKLQEKIRTQKIKIDKKKVS